MLFRMFVILRIIMVISQCLICKGKIAPYRLAQSDAKSRLQDSVYAILYRTYGKNVIGNCNKYRKVKVTLVDSSEHREVTLEYNCSRRSNM